MCALLAGLPASIAAAQEASEPVATAPADAPADDAEEAVEEAVEAAEERELHPLVAEAAERRGEMETLVERYDGLEEELVAARGEDRSVLLARMGDMRLEYLALLHEQAGNLLAQQGEGLETADLEREVKRQMGPTTGRIGELIVEAEQQVQRSRTPLEELDPATRRKREQKALDDMEMLDRLYAAMQEHLEGVEAVGLDPTTGRNWLTTHIERRADSLAAWLEFLDGRIESLQRDLEVSPDDAELKAELVFEERRLESVTTSFGETLGIMGDYDLETAEYRQLLIETTGELSGDILDGDVVVRLLRDASDRAGAWFREKGPDVAFDLLLFLAILLVTRVFARLTGRVVRRAVSTSRFSFTKLLQDTLVSWTSGLVTALGVLFALSQIGIDPGPLLAGLGIAGFVVGFALQETLANFASGAMILLYRPYDVGDFVETAGVFGQVSKMSLVSTTILTIDRQTLVVPNAKIWGNVIKNVSDQRLRRVDLKFGIAYGDDIEHAERVFKALFEEDERILSDPPPLLVVDELGDSAVVFKVAPWVENADYWDVKWDLTRAVKLRFDREGLHIPFPQRDVHLRDGVAPEPTRPSSSEAPSPSNRSSTRSRDAAEGESE
ncbi:MAG: mechanosensitive ion channel [bacterium]|nr:mechanosensitive ion channel [bacterium]